MKDQKQRKSESSRLKKDEVMIVSCERKYKDENVASLPIPIIISINNPMSVNFPKVILFMRKSKAYQIIIRKCLVRIEEGEE